MVDLTVAGARYDAVKSALDILTAAPEFDLVLAVLGSSARAQPETTARPIIESAAAGKPLTAFFAPEAPEALAMLSRAGIPNFHGPEACADAIAAALRRRAPRRSAARPRSSAGDARLLDELAAGALLDQHRHRSGSRHCARCRHHRRYLGCRFPIRLQSRFFLARSHTRPMPAASCSTSPTTRR